MDDALSVLSNQYGLDPQRLRLEHVSQGFSGAEVWKVCTEQSAYALKRFPPGQPVYLTLPQIHGLMQVARRRDVLFVPEVLRTRTGESCVSGRWEVASWQPGQPLDTPDSQCLLAAVHALAGLHAAWRPLSEERQSCLAVALRHRRLTEWTPADSSKLDVAIARDGLGQRAHHLLRSRRDRAIRLLQPWLIRKVCVQPCLGDVWAEHVLFTGTAVTGIVDFGGMRSDHPAQDVARLLGSYRISRQALAEVVRLYPGATDTWCELALLLVETGRIAAVANWLRWIYIERRSFSNRDAIAARLSRLVEQLDET